MAKLTYKDRVDEQRVLKIREKLLTLPKACTEFVNSISMKTSTLTRMAYTIDLDTFCNYAFKEIPYFSQKKPRDWTDEDFAHFSAKDFVGYSDYLTLYFKEDHKDLSSEQQRILRNHECGIMRKLSTLRSFFHFLFQNERIPGNIAALVSLPKLHEKPILHLVGPEIEKLLDVAETGDQLTERQKKWHEHTKLRDYAILMLFLGTGVRVSECVGLNLQDLDMDNNAMLVTRKGGNQVILYFPDEVRDALENYLLERRKLEPDSPLDKDALFLSLQNKRISQRSVEIMVKKYCSVAVPLKTKMSPHKLRSTYATRLYHETEDIYLVAEALGHADVNTTRKHYAAMSEERRKQAAKHTHLPGPKAFPTEDEDQLKNN